MRPCPNCGQPVAADRTVCPNCGANLPTVWPPPPSGQPDAPVPPVGKLITGTKKGDFVLGLVLSVISILVIVGFFIVPILYVILQGRFPNFARGLGWGWVLVVLGAFTVCFGPSLWSLWQHLLGH